TIHARKTSATFTPLKYTDMFIDDVKTLYDLGDPESHTIQVEQTYSESRKGAKARLDSLSYLAIASPTVIDLDTAKPLVTSKEGGSTVAKLEVPITDDKQSAHIKITGAMNDAAYKAGNGELTFDRTLHGLRNTVLLPAGWEVSGISQAGTIGLYQQRA